MNKIKQLVKMAKEIILASTKSKIIAGSIAGLVAVGSIGGVITYNMIGKGDKDPLPRVSEEQVKKDIATQKSVEKTDEEKQYDEKVIKLNELAKLIKELDPDFVVKEVSKDNVDSLIEEYTAHHSELLDKAEKEKEETKTEEVAQGDTSNSSSSNSGSSTSSSSTGGTEQAAKPSTPVSTPAPAPEPTPAPAPAPSIPSGNKPDVASEVISYMGSTNGPNSELYTAEQYNTIIPMVDQWFNGGIDINTINSTMKSKFPTTVNTYLHVTNGGTTTVKGLDAYDIANHLFTTFGYANNAFSKCTVYYDSSTDTSTIKYICGSI